MTRDIKLTGYDKNTGKFALMEEGDEASCMGMDYMPRVWVNGIQKVTVKEYLASATVSNGNVVFPLTDDGQLLQASQPIFEHVFLHSVNLFVHDSANTYAFGVPVLSVDRKSLTVPIRKLGFTSQNALITLLGGLASFLTGASYSAPANGLTVYLQIKGD